MEQNVPDTIFHNQLLALATSAKGDEPMDPTVKPMAKEDREWLRNVLKDYASDADPIKKLKRVMSSVEALLPVEATDASEVGSSTKTEADDSSERLRTIVDEELIDLICDLDLALDFCKLGGLQIIRRFFARPSIDAAVDASLLGVVAEIAQNNLPVQELIVREEFLIPHCLGILAASTSDESNEKADDEDNEPQSRRRCRAVGALSAIIRGYIPAAGKFARLNGPQQFVEFFEWALRRNDERLVHRCAVAAGGIARSFKREVAKAIKANYMADAIRKKLEASDPQKYEEALNFLRL